MIWNLTKNTAFYALVTLIVVLAVFPFYYAIITSFKTGSNLFTVEYFPSSFSLENYVSVINAGSFTRNLLNSLVVSTLVVLLALLIAVTASFALARVRFRGRSLLLLTILSVSMFPQIAVLAGLFEVVRFLGLYNTLWSLVFSYTIFTLPFTVWVLTTFMRDLPVEIEEAAIIQDIPWWKRMTRIIIPIQKTSIISGFLLPFMTCLRELTLFMLLCGQGRIITTMLDYFDEMGLYAFSSGINLILIVMILLFNMIVNKLTGASIDSGIGGGK